MNANKAHSYSRLFAFIRGQEFLTLGLDSVIPLARLHLPVLVAGADLDTAEGSIFGWIGGCIGDGVLAAHLRVQLVEGVLQRPVVHLAYPYGDRIAAGAREFALAQAAGFKTAVTTRPGMIFAENAGYLTALPRVSLNGNYQDERILPVLTSGAATAMWNGFRRVDAA